MRGLRGKCHRLHSMKQHRCSYTQLKGLKTPAWTMGKVAYPQLCERTLWSTMFPLCLVSPSCKWLKSYSVVLQSWIQGVFRIRATSFSKAFDSLFESWFRLTVVWQSSVHDTSRVDPTKFGTLLTLLQETLGERLYHHSVISHSWVYGTFLTGPRFVFKNF